MRNIDDLKDICLSYKNNKERKVIHDK